MAYNYFYSIFKEHRQPVSFPVLGKIASCLELLVKESRNASSITFLTDNFIIDPFGNTSTPTEILFRGAMAKLRVGDMLPRDYLPAAREEERP